MKNYFLLSALCFLAAVKGVSCPYTDSFVANGWVVHESTSFSKWKEDFVKNLEGQLQSGESVFDIGGPVVTRHTPDKTELLLDVAMFDRLSTPRDLMYGDYAVATTTDSARQIVELRWFDGAKRNIVINEQFITCFTEPAPFVENSVY